MTILIVGASLAGIKTATALREFGSTEPITMVGGENVLPYDRPPLSKTVLTDGEEFEDVALVSAEGLRRLDVTLILGKTATELDVEQRHVTLDDGENLSYDTLVIATGAHPRRLPWPELAGICYLRTFDDAVELRKRLVSSSRVVVVGGGFIGAEAAAAAHKLGCHVTILEAASAPLARVLGTEVGQALGQLHTQRGIDLRCGVAVTGVDGETHVTGVHLANGERLAADVVVVGIGAEPATAWLESSGLVIEDGLVCDEYCRAEGTRNIYAVGDVARWMNPTYGESMRVEHWTNAVEQAASVATSIIEGPEPYDHIPYVWSHQYDHQIQMVGKIHPGHTPTFVRAPNASTDAFVALYSSGDQLTGAVTVDLPALISKMKRLLSKHAELADAIALAERLI